MLADEMIVRALILLLLCMNLAVAAWWHWRVEPAPLPLPAQEAGVGAIQLLGEVDAPPPVVESAVATAPKIESPACISLGPFATPAALRQAMTALTPHAASIQYRELMATELRDYRVYMPAATDGNGALQVARALTARGVRDYYVVTAGDQVNTISLGLYRDLKNAEQRRDQLAALGFNAVLEPRTEQVRQWWIDLAVPRDFRWQDVLGEVALTVQDVACR